LIGRVTIAPVEVSTSSDVISHVTYSVANGKPTFIVRASSPVPKPKSESIPAEPIPTIPKQIEEPEPAATEQTQTEAPATPVTTPETQEPPKVTELTPTIQAPTESQTSTPQGVSITNLTDTPQA
jgi:hypothetical protein